MKAVLSVGVIPFYLEEVPKFLLLRCFKYWDFPKGQVEEGEDPRQTALRELKEETGIDQKIVLSKTFVVTETYGQNKTARYYLGQLKSQPEVTILKNPVTGIVEHHEYRWVTYEEGLELVVPRIKKVLYWASVNINESSTPK